jgi:hypothetical protein
LRYYVDEVLVAPATFRIGRPEGCPMSDLSQDRPRSSRPGFRGRPQSSRPYQDAAARQAVLAALRSALEGAGLDLERLGEQRRRGRAELESALAGFRTASDARAPALGHAVGRTAQNWLDAHRVRGALAPATGHYSVSTAELISVTLGIDLQAEHVGPWANTAEVAFSRQTDDVDGFDGEVTFSFSWPNPTGEDVVCTVTGLLGVVAAADVTADGYWWPLDPTPPASEIDVLAELRLRVLEADGQVTVPPYQDIQSQEIVYLVAHGDWTEGTITGQDIVRGYVLQYTDLFLPAGARLQADLTCEIAWLALDGGGQFIAAGNGRQLSGFGLFIETQP